MKRFIICLVAVGALAAPATALANGGVVLKANHASRLAAIKGAKGVMLVHTAQISRLHAGQRVRLSARRLANGTFASSTIRVIGRASHVQFSGLLLARTGHRVTVSAGGEPVDLKTTAATNARPGSEVQVSAEIDDQGDLNANGIQVVNTLAPGGTIEGKIVAIGASSVTVASDEQVLALTVPSGFDLTTFAVGEEVLAQFSQQSDGSLLLTTLSSDEGVQGANGQGEDDGQSTGGDNNSTTGDDSSTSDDSSASSDNSSGDSGQSSDSGSGGEDG